MTPDAIVPGLAVAPGLAFAPDLAVDHFLARLTRPARLMVAISGGSDSSGLIHLLHRHRKAHPESGVSLCAATIDHALRPGSADEAETVARLCATLGIPHAIRRREGEKPKSAISATAREARYRLLAEAASDFSADAILIAHTLDDQQETLAMRAARSGPDFAPGMAGIAPATLVEGRIWALRPLIRCSRAAIRDYLRLIGEGWIDDPSNADPHYERVRVRRRLADDRSLAITKPDAATRAILSRAAARLIETHGKLHGGTVLQLSSQALAGDPHVLRYALGGLLAATGGGAHRPQAATMDRLFAALRTGDAFRMTLARCVIERRRDGLYLCREDRDLPRCVLGPNETAIWDDRFRIVNTTDLRVSVTPSPGSGSDILPNPLPPRLAALGRRSRPDLGFDDPAVETADMQSVAVTPFFPHFERFLPVYDLEFANAVLALFERAAFPGPPGTHY